MKYAKAEVELDMQTQTTVDVLPHLENFKQWLQARGAQVLPPCEWEMLRFSTDKGLSVLYYRKRGSLTWVGEAKEAWTAFRLNRGWRATTPTRRKGTKGDVKALRLRDGDYCFFCCQLVSNDDASIEHLVPLSQGGPDHIGNKFLSHKLCNGQVGNKSAAEKVAVRVDFAVKLAMQQFIVKKQKEQND